MTDAQRILKEDFGIEFTLPHVCNIVRQLGLITANQDQNSEKRQKMEKKS